MQWWTDRPSTETWVAAVDGARQNVAAARTHLDTARTAAAALTAATAWASPAMTAFQHDLGRWLESLALRDEALRTFDQHLGDARARLMTQGWSGLG
jgi:hypothetical protein